MNGQKGIDTTQLCALALGPVVFGEDQNSAVCGAELCATYFLLACGRGPGTRRRRQQQQQVALMLCLILSGCKLVQLRAAHQSCCRPTRTQGRPICAWGRGRGKEPVASPFCVGIAPTASRPRSHTGADCQTRPMKMDRAPRQKTIWRHNSAGHGAANWCRAGDGETEPIHRHPSRRLRAVSRARMSSSSGGGIAASHGSIAVTGVALSGLDRKRRCLLMYADNSCFHV